MVADCRYAKEQRIGDFLVRKSFRQQPQHIQLPVRELRAFCQAQSDHRRAVRENMLPGHGTLHDLQHRLLLHLLVPEGIHADLSGPLQEHTVRHGCHNNDLDPRICFLYSGGGLQPVGTVIHHDIHQYKIHPAAGTIGIRDLCRIHRSRKFVIGRCGDKVFK